MAVGRAGKSWRSGKHKHPAGKESTAWENIVHVGDAGWGELVRLGKYRDGHYSDDLVTACAAVVREWAPHPGSAMGDEHTFSAPSRIWCRNLRAAWLPP